MNQKKLHKTVETIASQKFPSDEEMLKRVVNEIVHDPSTGFTGGRIWKLFPDIEGYRLLYQTGKMEKIEKDFVITGGQSKNVGIVKRIEKLIGFNCLPLPKNQNSELDPTTAGAIGAALFSKALYEKSVKE